MIAEKLDAMQAMSVELLKDAGIHVRDDGSKLVYVQGQEVEAEYFTATRTLVWRSGTTTRQQDQCIRIHAELSIRR